MNKRGLKIMAIIFAGLIVLTILVTLLDNKKETGNFKSLLADINSEEIDRIDINLPGEKEAFSLVRTGADNWEIRTNNEMFPAESGSISSLLSQSTQIKVKQVVAKDEKNWGKYSVNDSLGTRIRMFKDDELISGLMIGRMTFSQARSPYQQQPDAFTYIREEDEPIVYSTLGMLSMMVTRGIDYFRNATVIQANKNNLNRISFNYPADSSFLLIKPDTIWRVNEIASDSAATESYLSSITNHNNRSFASPSNIKGAFPVYEILFEGDNMEAISLKAWTGISEDQYFLTSTQNEGTVFKMNQAQFERLFKTKSDFLK
jgi:hypothetical protein